MVVKRLVFADDSSRGADVAWLWINNHRWPGWRIEVVTAVPNSDGPPDVLQLWEPPKPRQLLQLTGATSETPVVHERISCEPRKALADCKDRDLLVLGPRGTGLLKALRLGSTSEALLNDPPAPMVIARSGRASRRVVVCADGSAHSRTAKESLMRMPWASEAEVLVVCVPQAGFNAEKVAQSAAQTLSGMVASVSTHVPELDELQAFYHPRDIILEVLNTWSADLVVLGSRGLSRWEALRAGSIATSLAAHAPCSVLLAPESLG